MWLLLRISMFAALGGFLFGYDLGLIGGALLEIKSDFQLADGFIVEAIVGGAKLGAVVGTFLGGACMLQYGRRKSIALNSLFFSLGPLIMSFAISPWMLVLGRLVVGLGIGSSAIVVPAYLAELAPARVRGALVSVYEMMLCIGMLAASAVDWALVDVPGSWRLMVGVPALPGLMLALSLLLLPESPRWLVAHRRFDEALAIIHVVLQDAGTSFSTKPRAVVVAGEDGADAPSRPSALAEAEDELLQLWSEVEKDTAAVEERRRILLQQRMAAEAEKRVQEDLSTAPLLDAAGEPAMAAEDGGLLGADARAVVSGTCGYEAPGFSWGQRPPGSSSWQMEVGTAEDSSGSFLHTLGSMLGQIAEVARGPERRALVIALCLAFFNQASGSTAAINYAPTELQDVGRMTDKGAVAYSAVIGLTKTVGVGIGMLMVDHIGRRQLLFWGALLCAVALLMSAGGAYVMSAPFLLGSMCLFIFSFAVSWAGTYWVVVSEIFTMSAKSPATSASTAFLFLVGSLTNFVYLALLRGLGPSAFLIFASISIAAAVYVWLAVPETKGRTLSQITVLLQSDVGTRVSDAEQEGLELGDVSHVNIKPANEATYQPTTTNGRPVDYSP